MRDKSNIRKNLQGNSSWCVIFVAVFFVVAAVGQAKAVTLTATDSGFVTEMGGSAKGDGTITTATYNYSVGYEEHFADGSLSSPPPFPPMDRNNYFVFDMTGESGTIISASFEVYTGKLESPVDLIETFDLVAPMTPGLALADADFLLASNAIGSSEFDSPGDPAVGMAAALYGNIEGGAGGPLATAIITPADDISTILIPFAPPGLAYLNSFVGSRVIIGGSVPTIDLGSGAPQQPFGFTDVDIAGGDPLSPKLVLTFDSPPPPPGAIPEPSTFTLALMGMLMLSCHGRRRRRR